MQRKDLALRVLSTAAIMSIVTSIAAPAFADIYYIGNGSIDVVTKEDADGKKYVEVKQGDKTYTDTSDEIVIKDGTSEDNATLTENTTIDGKRAEVAVPDKERTDTQELEAAGSADAAGESQPDPDAAFTLSEAEEDSARPRRQGHHRGEERARRGLPQEGCGVRVRPGRPESGAAGHETRPHLCRPCGKDQGGHSGRRPRTTAPAEAAPKNPPRMSSRSSITGWQSGQGTQNPAQ